MFYLIGLGLDLESISKEALEICEKADKVYLENYTADFPYDVEKLAGVIENRVIPLTRIMVESEDFVDEARKKDVVLLVYGSPLIATTHISLILKCKKEKISYKVFHNASILDAIGETGLQVYKFGKTASMPKWKENYKPESFFGLIKFNLAVKAHTLILVDIGLTFPEALKQLTKVSKNRIKLGKIVVCSQLGTSKTKIYYSFVSELLGAEVYPPFCFIIPSELHFLEKEFLEKVKEPV